MRLLPQNPDRSPASMIESNGFLHPASSNEMLQAQLRQAAGQVQKAMMERETYVRVCAVLSNYITQGGTVPMLDGCITVTPEQFAEVPQLYRVSVTPAKVREGDDPNALEKDVLVVKVEKKPEPPLLTVARGVE